MKCKVLIVSALICLSVLSLYAQKEDKRYHLFGTENLRQFKEYVGPLVAISNVEGNVSVDLGVTGGLIVNNKFFVGGYFQGLLTKPPRTDLAAIGYPTFNDGEIKMLHGGMLFGYIHKPAEMIHWGISSSFGVGALYLYAKDTVNQNTKKLYRDRVYVITPKFFVEMNMTNWWKVNISAGYRFFGKVNSTYINQAHEELPLFYKSDFNHPEYMISLLFGNFTYHSGVLHK